MTNLAGFSGALDLLLPATGCGVPASSAYSLNATVIPRPRLDFLTLWPTASKQPTVSTLNSFDGSVVSNAALVPANTNGSITALHTQAADLILDVNGYFAP